MKASDTPLLWLAASLVVACGTTDDRGSPQVPAPGGSATAGGPDTGGSASDSSAATGGRDTGGSTSGGSGNGGSAGLGGSDIGGARSGGPESGGSTGGGSAELGGSNTGGSTGGGSAGLGGSYTGGASGVGSGGILDVLLDIPPREQWTNDGGYCGCCSIQQIALYYGTYVSQDMCRSAAQNSEVLVAVNEDAVLDALSLEYEPWDFSGPTPQYEAYMTWVKQHLNDGAPVIITVYMQNLTDADYDHIVPAIGFTSEDATTYHDADELIFNDCFASTSFTRAFASLWDTQDRSGNCTTHEYCIPLERDFGCAVTGVQDDGNITQPVQISLAAWSEPNVTVGETATLLDMEVAVRELTVGEAYVLLRYDDLQSVPSSGFVEADAETSIRFTARDAVETFAASVMSDGLAIYRCIAVADLVQ